MTSRAQPKDLISLFFCIVTVVVMGLKRTAFSTQRACLWLKDSSGANRFQYRNLSVGLLLQTAKVSVTKTIVIGTPRCSLFL
jgi:hypothetical protein